MYIEYVIVGAGHGDQNTQANLYRAGSEKDNAMVPRDKWQYITDAEGNRIGVILPLEEFALIEETLEQRIRAVDLEAKLKQMEQAASDPRFLTDMQETMDAFAEVDAEWWEIVR